MYDIADDMCPNCVTPWKCNGPHISPHDFDAATVCIAHGSFVPCRKRGEHRETQNPYWVKAVADYHGSPIEDLTWEPARLDSVTKW